VNVKKLLGFAVGPIGGAVVGALTVPLVAWVFSPSDVGRLNILQVSTSFVVVAASLGFDQAYVREFHEVDDRARLLRTTFVPGLVTLGLAALPMLVFSTALSESVFDTSDSRTALLAFAAVCVAFVTRFASLILRMQERALAFSLGQIVPKIGTVAGVGLIAITAASPRFIHIELVVFLASLATLAVLLYQTRSDWAEAVRSTISRDQVVAYARFGLPLVFSGLAYWGLTATSTVTFRITDSLQDLGIYSVAVSIAGVAGIVQAFFSVIWAPIVYRWIAEGVDPGRVDLVVRQLLTVIWFAFVLVGSMSWLIEYFLPAAYSEVKYLAVGSVVPPLMYVLSEATSVGIGISRRSTLSIWAAVLSLVVSVVLNLWLVPLAGARGAVTANTIAYLVFLVARTELSMLAWRPFPRATIYAALGVLLTCSTATVMFGGNFGSAHIPVWLALGVVGIWVFRSEVWMILQQLPGRGR